MKQCGVQLDLGGVYFPSIEDDWALGLIDSQSVAREAWRRTLQACVSDEDLVEFARQTFATLELGRHELFEVIVVSGEIGVMKPDPEIFEAALERIDVDRDRVWHVGAWVSSDVAAAREAGP